MYVATSVFLWKFLGSVFIPNLLTRAVLMSLPIPADLETLVSINANLFYFGPYFLFGIMWPQWRRYFKHAFLAGIALWLVNLLVVFPMMGRGLLGYRLPQGWMAVTFPLLLSHWLFARGLQYQTRS
jgi:hypothetical protein